MAKKKRKASSSGKKTNWTLILLIILVIILLAGLLYQERPDLFDHKPAPTEQTASPGDSSNKKSGNSSDNSSKKKKKASTESKADSKTKGKTSTGSKTDAKATTESKADSKISTGSKTDAKATTESSVGFDIKAIRDLDIPAEIADRPEQLIRHSGYTVSYNQHWCISNWVGYELTREETKGTEKRTNKFVVDPLVKGRTATDADYRNSGYDRGHLAPAADMTWSQTAMKESFYFSNMTPQAPSLNRGVWKNLEDKVRKWADRDSAIYIVCGPIVSLKSKTIGKNKVVVPDAFYKVILSPYGSKPKAIGFIFANEGSLQPLETFAVPVDSVEKLTGIDFFHQLPDDIENRIERGYTISDWF